MATAIAETIILNQAPPVVTLPDLNVPSSAALAGETRGHKRYACEGGVQLRPAGHSGQTYATLTDMSASGCYVELLSPLRPGTRVGMCINILSAGRTFCVMGVVRTSHHSVGMGIEFIEVTEVQRGQIEEALRILEEKERDAKGIKPPPVLPPSPEMRARMEQIRAVKVGLIELQNALRPEELYEELLHESREALVHARTVLALALQWMEGQQREQVLGAVMSEQLRAAAAANENLAESMTAHETPGETVRLRGEVAELARRLWLEAMR